MKKLALILCMLSGSVLAAEPNLEGNYLDNLAKDWSNPSLFKQHHIVLVKEVQHKFLFLHYTKEEIINEVSLTGPSGMFSNTVDIPYVSMFESINGQPIMTDKKIHTGTFINIAKVSDNSQTLTFSKTDLISLENLKVDNINIQLPNITETSFTVPINENMFEKTWTDSDGQTYRFKYSGEKYVVKS